ncbi:uncharacterized protein SPAPADRAFT_65150 [Spathaspora passalidarum NRRL Y-27907]|uniref:Uncharacterized protein n=1 Tax=Spathaspora passalidarum (strain NRRL Y-27907 / 11-Y1) TaxID=619300 RepID=G3AJQ1_SPAPN|nr:uncharacterized protein SPAPADRAFT_65150 [Spathaspora passalidarum NRRL Y-27907]EGW33952.1 hypothetical protein SPAPADRAFT_65150 [Spathaspora passalidarum NRRL Y-27907]
MQHNHYKRYTGPGATSEDVEEFEFEQEDYEQLFNKYKLDLIKSLKKTSLADCKVLMDRLDELELKLIDVVDKDDSSETETHFSFTYGDESNFVVKETSPGFNSNSTDATINSTNSSSGNESTVATTPISTTDSKHMTWKMWLKSFGEYQTYSSTLRGFPMHELDIDGCPFNLTNKDYCEDQSNTMNEIPLSTRSKLKAWLFNGYKVRSGSSNSVDSSEVIEFNFGLDDEESIIPKGIPSTTSTDKPESSTWYEWLRDYTLRS